MGDYFQKVYGVRLRYPFLPCINAKGKKAKKGPEYYPLEMCDIVARQPVRGKLADNEVASMIRATAQPAPDTFRTISDTFKNVRGQFDPDLASVGLAIEDKMMKVPIRVVNNPPLNYKDGRARIKDGAWNPMRFQHVRKINTWLIGLFSSRRDEKYLNDLHKFAGQMQQVKYGSIFLRQHF